VWSWLSDPAAATDPRAKDLLPHLQDLYALYKVLDQRRDVRGAIDFETVELQLVFDKNGKIERIVPSPRNDAHKLIEECMLAANVCAADLLAKAGHPALYRVHEGPTPEKLEQLRAFLGASALSLGGGEQPSAPRLREAPREDQAAPRLRAAADRVCCARSSGALPSGQRRPLRPLAYEAYAAPRRSAATPTCSSTARSTRCCRRSATGRPARTGRSSACTLVDGRAPRH
jgi:ribonuclease R